MPQRHHRQPARTQPTSRATTPATAATRRTALEAGDVRARRHHRATASPATTASRRPARTSTTSSRRNSCESCHATFTWRPATKVDHTQVTGSCYSCHNGTTATGKHLAHLSTHNDCDTCHATTAWKPATKVDHAQVLGTCSSCHDGTHATGKDANHIATTADCDTCHTTLAWKPATFDHSGIVNNLLPRLPRRQDRRHRHDARVARSPGSATNDTAGRRATDNGTAWQARAHRSDARLRRSRRARAPLAATTATAYGSTGKSATHIRPATAARPATRRRPGSRRPRSTTRRSPAAATPATTARRRPARTRRTSCRATPATPATRRTPGSRRQGGPRAGDRQLLLLPQRHDRDRQDRRRTSRATTTATTCHTPMAWKPAHVSTTPASSATASSCHDGVKADGQERGAHRHQQQLRVLPRRRRPGSRRPRVDHTQVTGTCSSCHNGTTATGKDADPHPDHGSSAAPATRRSPGSRRASATPASPAAARAATTACKATGKNATHIFTTQHLRGLPRHRRPGSRRRRVDHAQVLGTCSQLPQRHQRDRQDRGPHRDHAPTAAAATARLPGSRRPASITPASSRNCFSCHNGVNRDGQERRRTSRPHTQLRELPRARRAWKPRRARRPRARCSGTCSSLPQRHQGDRQGHEPHPDHRGVRQLPHDAGLEAGDVQPRRHHRAAAATCHDGVKATGKNATHIFTTNVCEACHATVGAGSRRRKVDHAQVLGTCTSCHNGTTRHAASRRPHRDDGGVQRLPRHDSAWKPATGFTTRASPATATAATTA